MIQNIKQKNEEMTQEEIREKTKAAFATMRKAAEEQSKERVRNLPPMPDRNNQTCLICLGLRGKTVTPEDVQRELEEFANRRF